MAQVKHRGLAAKKPAATNSRNFRTFLLVAQLEAKAIGERIAQARREAAMTQDDLAELTTFSRRSLQDYEAGVTIPYKHMSEIATLLNRSVAWFLHGEESEWKPDQKQAAAILDRLAAATERVESLADRLEGLTPARDG